MTGRYPMDPEDPERSRQVLDEIVENFVPAEPVAVERVRMRERVLARVRDARNAMRGVTFVRPCEDDFSDLMNGVRVLELSTVHHAVLLEFAPGASLPQHRHREDEECVVIRGSARIDDIRVQEGDYHLAYARSRHAPVRSDHGALLYVRGTSIGSLSGVLRDLASAWIPGRSVGHMTLRADDAGWVPMSPGVTGRVLHERDGSRSLMCRMAAGARLQAAMFGRLSESIVVSGDAYVGDEHVARGDYAWIDGGQVAPEIFSDSGATMFLRLTDALPMTGRPTVR